MMSKRRSPSTRLNKIEKTICVFSPTQMLKTLFMKRIIFLLAIISLIIFSNCTTTRPITDKPAVILEGVSEASALLDLVRATNLPYEWYVATGNGTIDWDDQRLG